jgi:Cupin-like domain
MSDAAESSGATVVLPPSDIEDRWRIWIAENLILGSSAEDLLDVLAGCNLPRDTAARELDRAANHPYVKGAQRIRNRLLKREWLLDIGRRLNRLRPPVVERRHRLDRDSFFNDHYVANRPVIITGMMDQWSALRRWTLDHLRREFGDTDVEVQWGRDTDAEYEINSVAHRRLMRFGDYVDLVERAGRTNDFYMTANNSATNRSTLDGLGVDILPMPDYLDAGAPEQWFLWFGPAGTVTPLHHDLTNNLMAQVIGRKRVVLAPPCETPNLYNHHHCFSAVDLRSIDDRRFPAMRNVQLMECELRPGELLFVPVGWWHFVESLDVSVTISFTNFVWSNDYTECYPELLEF